MKSWKLLAALAVAGGMVVGATLTSTAAFADPDKGMGKKKDDEKKLAIGTAAPGFTLTDTDGKSVNLSDYAGKFVVLEWYNPECPFVKKHHSESVGNMTFKKLYDEYNSKGVVFLAVNSSAKDKQGWGKDTNVKYKAEYKIAYPVLLDEDGKVGKAYGATNTPHMFVIGKDGKLIYRGAIDDNQSMEKAGEKNYVKMALDEALAGKPVTTAETKAYGCSVKYSK